MTDADKIMLWAKIAGLSEAVDPEGEKSDAKIDIDFEEFLKDVKPKDVARAVKSDEVQDAVVAGVDKLPEGQEASPEILTTLIRVAVLAKLTGVYVLDAVTKAVTMATANPASLATLAPAVGWGVGLGILGTVLGIKASKSAKAGAEKVWKWFSKNKRVKDATEKAAEKIEKKEESLETRKEIIAEMCSEIAFAAKRSFGYDSEMANLAEATTELRGFCC